MQSGTGASGPAPRVLVCDDMEPIRRLLRINLELAGFTVEEAADGFRMAELAVDGQLVASLSDGDVVTCQPAEERARFVRFRPHYFHQILKAKFGLQDR